MRIGIIGTGRIAERFVRTVCLENVSIECVYNPRIASAERFALEHGIANYTDKLTEFCDRVEAVYIASPHETHYDYALKMLEKEKHVLCEKPLAFCKSDAEKLFQVAAEKKCVLMEAIKTAYCPGFISLLEKARSGIIGEIRDVEATFTRLTDNANLREFQNVSYGGSMTEFGSYVLMPAVKLLGADIKDITFHSIREENGVDVYTKTYLEYEKGMAMAKTGLKVKSEGQLLISGTKGYILVPSPWWMTKYYEIRFEDPSKKEEYHFDYVGSGLQYECEVFLKRIQGDAADNPVGMMPEESIVLAGIFEKFLAMRH